jgi:hypothetical protein
MKEQVYPGAGQGNTRSSSDLGSLAPEPVTACAARQRRKQ